MTAVEVIYLVAASLWLCVVVAALCVGIRFVVRFRARRRRINRLLALVRTPVRLCKSQGSEFHRHVNHTLMNVVADALNVAQEQTTRGPLRSQWRR